MTTRPLIEVHRSARRSGFRFVASPDIAVVSILAARDASNTSLRDALNSCVATWRSMLHGWLGKSSDLKVYFFAATPFWLKNNAVARRRALWGLPDLRWLKGSVARTVEVEFSTDDGSRFAGVAELSEECLEDAVNYTRAQTSLVIVSTSLLSRERVTQLFSAAFPSGTPTIDWHSMITEASLRKLIVVKTHGLFDDRQVSLDIFMPPEKLDHFAEKADP